MNYTEKFNNAYAELEKAIKDRSHLMQKQITDKNGHRRTVWVKTEEKKVVKPENKEEPSKQDDNKKTIDYAAIDENKRYEPAQNEMLDTFKQTLEKYGATFTVNKRENGGIQNTSVKAEFKNGWSIYTTLEGSVSSSWFSVKYNGDTVAEKSFDFKAYKWNSTDRRNHDIKTLTDKLNIAINQMKNHDYDIYVNKKKYPNGLPDGVKAPPVKSFEE